MSPMSAKRLGKAAQRRRFHTEENNNNLTVFVTVTTADWNAVGVNDGSLSITADRVKLFLSHIKKCTSLRDEILTMLNVRKQHVKFKRVENCEKIRDKKSETSRNITRVYK